MKYTNEQIRGAILRAADYIEQHPDRYDFMNGTIMSDGGMWSGCKGACMLHYVGVDLGMRSVTAKGIASNIGLNHADGDDRELYEFARVNGLDRHSPTDAPKILRGFADARFPALSTPIVAEDRQLVRWDQCAWKPAGVRA